VQRLIVPVTALTIVFAVGIGWYWLVEEFTFLDSVYQTVITLSTVGYEETEPLDSGGRIFTIFFILAGIGLMFYTATAVVELVVAGEVRDLLGRRRTGRRVDRMENHVIVCGYGRVGQKITDELSEHGVDHVVVDMRAEAVDAAASAGTAVLHGDATEEPVLLAAHIERARALVAAADSDVGNTYIVLTARSLNPEMFIVARAGGGNAEQRMISAGADRVISPYQMAGFRMALSVVQPLMLDFVDILAARETRDEKILAEIVVAPGSGLDGRSRVRLNLGPQSPRCRARRTRGT
jgi:voltage-gated potassium channel